MNLREASKGEKPSKSSTSAAIPDATDKLNHPSHSSSQLGYPFRICVSILIFSCVTHMLMSSVWAELKAIEARRADSATQKMRDEQAALVADAERRRDEVRRSAN
jgi:hypothetical protein